MRQLSKGNVAIIQGAILAGCRAYYGYPITPASEVAEAAAELTEVGRLVSVAVGGDTVAALNAAGVTDRLTHVSTAGGAFLEWLEGKALPGVEVLRVK